MPRKEHQFHYIYKTTCKVTGKFYVGMHSTSNLDDNYIGSGKRLWYSIRKWGKENHEREILEWLPNRTALKQREKEIVNEEFLLDPLCMNLSLGGEGGFIDKNSAASGAKGMNKKIWQDSEFIERKKKSTSELCSKLHAEKKIHAPSWKGRKHSEATIEKLKGRGNQLGEKNSQFNTCWIHNEFLSKKIKKDELSLYISQGWKVGRKIKF